MPSTPVSPPVRVDLAALAARLPPRPVTRFAPAPTGSLHLGHAVNAIYVWGIARALGGVVTLRIEDHDRSRCRPAYERALLDDLDWLGLAPDRGTPAELRAGASDYRQSDRGDRYVAALAPLREAGSVYACECSRKDLARSAGDRFGEETRYAGRCRARGLAETAGRGLRVRMDEGRESFDDALLGALEQAPAEQCGDLLVRDRLGQWTYQLAVVVDDLRHGVDLVIRGADLLDSTGRQLRLARLLGRPRPPVFLHHPLIRKASGAKLSKSDGDTGLRDLRAAGATPEEVLGRAAHLAGLVPAPRPLSVAELPSLLAEGA